MRCYVALLLGLVAIVCAQNTNFTPLNFTNGVASTTQNDVPPCHFDFYHISPPLNATTKYQNYLQVQLSATTENVEVVISNEPYTGANWIRDSLPGVIYVTSGSETEQSIICNYPNVDTWYVSVHHQDDGSGNFANYTLSATVVPVAVTVTPVDANSLTKYSDLDLETYATSYDFFQIQFPDTFQLQTGDELVFTVTNNPYPINEMAFNHGSLPVTGFESNNCASSRNVQENVLVVDYCTLVRIASELNNPPSFLAIQPDSAVYMNYTLSWEWKKANPKEISPNIYNQETYTLFDNEIAYFQFDVTENDETFLNATVMNVQGGSVDFVIAWEELPFIACLDNSCDTYLSNCCSDVDTSCELLVPECRVASGTYYLGVKALSLDDNTKPLSFQLQADISETPYTSEVKTGLFYTGNVHQAHTDFYSFETETEDDATFEVHLYIDQNEPNQSGRITTLYVNADNPAGTNGTCWGNVAACSITDAGACTIQINPCRYAQFDKWYLSVFGGNSTTYYGSPVAYTLMAKLTTPTLLNTPFLVSSYNAFPNEYQHFQLSENLIEDGGQASLVFYDVTGGDLTVYLNFGGLAGPINTCPVCYNYTQTRTVTAGEPMVWTIANCNSTVNDNRDAVFFSVVSSPSAGQSSVDYSLLLTATDNELEPLDTLQESHVLVDIVGAQTAMNYTIEGADDADSYLEVRLTQINNIQGNLLPLSLAVHNTSQLNCIGDVYTVTQPTVRGTLSLVVDPCRFNTSESDWIIQVINPNDVSVHYNLEYIIHSVTPRQLSNQERYASELSSGIMEQFSYTMSGEGTVTVEVYFNDHQLATVKGQLFVSFDGIPGPNTNNCYHNEFQQTDADQCAWGKTSCRFEEGDTVYFSVGNVGLPFDDTLAYSVEVIEESAVQTFNVANITQPGHLYSGQSAYYTFNVAQDSTEGSRIVVSASNVQNGDVNLYLAQSASPFESGSCPCFEYGSELEVDYCNWEPNSSTWTVLAQATPTQENDFVGFTLNVRQEVNQATPLQMATQLPGAVMQDQYKYYQLADQVSTDTTHLYVYVSSISGGAITVYFNDAGPATSQCSTETKCDGETDSCLFDLSTACTTAPQYLSVYGKDADSSAPIRFNIQVMSSTLLTLNATAQLDNLKSRFTNLYSLDVADTSSMTSPELTVTVASTNLTAAYTISLYSGDCDATALATMNCGGTEPCSLSISECELPDSYYASVYNPLNGTIQYTISQSVQDLAANEIQLTEDQSTNITLAAYGSQTYYMQVASGDVRQSLTWSVQVDASNVEFHFGEGSVTPQCNEDSDSSVANRQSSGSVNVCQLQSGYYRLLVVNTLNQTVTGTVSFTLANAIAKTIDLGILSEAANATGFQPSATFTLDSQEVQELKFTMSPSYVYAAWFLSAQLGNNNSLPADLYLQTVSDAGTPPATGERCLTNTLSFPGSKGFTHSSVQCELEGDYLAKPYEGGTFYVGVKNTAATTQTFTMNITAALQQYTTLQIGQSQTVQLTGGQSAYLLINSNTTTVSQNLEIMLEGDSRVDATLYGQDVCGPSQASCPQNNNGNCTLSEILCGINSWNSSQYGLLIRGGAQDTSVTVTVSLVDRFLNVINLNDGNSVAVISSSVVSYTADANGPADFGVLQLKNYTGNANNIDVTYYLEGSGVCGATPGQTQCVDNGDSSTCTYTIDPCNFFPGLYYFQITAAGNANYVVEFSVVTETLVPLIAPQVAVGSLFPGDADYFAVQLNRTNIKPGQSLSVNLDVACGDITLYTNFGGSTASLHCYDTTASQFEIDACSLLALPPTNDAGDYFTMSVVGQSQAYPGLDLPSQYVLEVAVTGPAASFQTVGSSQMVPLNTTGNFIYTFPVPGLDDFVGQLVIELSGSSASLQVSYDEPTLCKADHVFSVNGNQQTNQLILNACDLDSVRQIFISFEYGASVDSAFQITHTKPYVRDLDEYTTIPQTGGVVPFAPADADNEIIDQEYYRLTPDFSSTNYTINIWLENAVPGIQLLVAQGKIPTQCDSTDPDVTVVGPNTNVTLDWCELELGEDIFITVNYPSTQASQDMSYGYDLYYSMAADPAVSLSAGQSYCDTLLASEQNFYTLAGSQPGSNQHTVLTVYSLSGDCSLDVSYSSVGAASNACSGSEKCNLCSGDKANCTYDLSCAPAGTTFSVAVSNPNNQEVDYFVVWTQTAVSTQQSDQVTTTTPKTGNAGNTYFYVTFPDADPMTQFIELQVIPDESTSEDFGIYFSSGHLPTPDCYDYEGGLGSYILFNSCDFPTAGYVLIEAPVSYTVKLVVTTVPATDLDMNVFYENQFPRMNDDNETVLFDVYNFVVDADTLAAHALNDLYVSVYGVHQGSMVVSIGNRDLDAECLLQSKLISETGSLVVPVCDFVPGHYFIAVTLATIAKPYTPVTYGLMATMGQSTAPVTSISNAINDVVFPPYTQQFYNFTADTDVVEIIFSYDSSFPIYATLFNIGNTAICQQDITPGVASYFWNCNGLNGQSYILLEGTSGGLNEHGPYRPTFTLEVNKISPAALTSTAATIDFGSGPYLTTRFFEFTANGSQSTQIEVNTNGAVQIELWSNDCDDDTSNENLLEFDCFESTCLIPFSWDNGRYSNVTSKFIVSVTGFQPTKATISLLRGQSETCVQPESTDLCDITWSVWNYGTSENGFAAQEAASLRLYNQLVNAFCPPCGCPEISKSCNESLVEYVCMETYRACDSDGMQTSVCQDTCLDIQENCGYTFEQVGLPLLACNHNSYYTGSDDICTDIYGISVTDGTDVWLWIVIAVVAVVAIIIIAAVIGFLAFKKFKHGRQTSTYESISGIEED